MESDDASADDKVIWHVEMLGRLRVRCALPSTPAAIEHFQTQKTALLLALLVLHQAEGNAAPPLYRDDLAARLWPDADQDAGRDRLSQALSWLRRHLEAGIGLAPGTVLRADRRMIGLVPGVVAGDVKQMEALASRARTLRRSDPSQAAIFLTKAIALHHGPLLPGIADLDEDLLLERHRLAAALPEMLRGAVIAAAAAGRLASAIGHARRLLQMDAENANDCALLMRLLAQAGDPTGAMRVFTEFAARLSAQSISLPESLRRLAREIQPSKEVIAPVAASAPLLSSTAFPVPLTVLPLPLTRYFGRETELQWLQASLHTQEIRLLTLLGPGGTGKTRLAIEAARRLIAQDNAAQSDADSPPFRAAFFVSLESAPDASQIMPAVLRALQSSSPEMPEDAPQEDGARLRAAVARLLAMIARPLLILDNCEHLAGSADTVGVLADLLLRVPALAIVATSRVRLGVEGEQQLLVPPLPAPHQALTQAQSDVPVRNEDALLIYPSVQMFVDRARRARPDFALTPANRDTVAALCGRLEGIPLAIELCAAWAATLTPSEMLAALDNRFDLLVSRRPDVPPRHRSLYAAVESSYLRLTPGLQAVFCALSVFRGGWTAEAAQAVMSPDTEGTSATDFYARNSLAALQERSLIFTERKDGEDAAMRWQMLDTLREFAASQSSVEERAGAAVRHAAWFLQWAETVAPHLTLPGQRAWLDALEIEHDNFQATLAALCASSAQALHGDTAGTDGAEAETAVVGLRLCLALDRFWLLRGYSHLASEHLAWFLPRVQNALPSAERETLLARGYTMQGRAFAAQGDLPAALAPLETALRLWQGVEDNPGRASALMALGEVCYWLGRKNEALALLIESEAAARRVGDDLQCAAVLLTLGSIALDELDMARAERLHLESLGFARRQDNRRLVARALCNLGEIAREQQRLSVARERGEAALAAALDVGDQATGCYILISLGRIACDAGDAVQASRYVREGLRYVNKAGTRRLLILCLLLAAQVANLQGRQERCAVLLGAGQSLRDTVSVRLIHGEARTETSLIETAQQILGEIEYAEAFARGLALTPDIAAEYALHPDPD